ncbi:MAG: LytTR family DNA-binding domain-containing protein [Bacteroidetes bacterium]|nr:LytTR family DNA-binding domain-containing protein [Bacteroidota bacterium]
MTEKLTAILVDDEDLARESLEAMITGFIPELTVAGTARDIPEAVRLIKRSHPRIVFLDIELPGYSGLQILEFFNPEEIDFDIIFTTAYSQYALRAFQLSAVDYLLKPIQIDDLAQSVKKILKRNRQAFPHGILKENLASAGKGKLVIPHAEGYSFLSLEEILFVKAAGAYSEFIMTTGKKLLVGKNLKDFETALDNRHFFRPNRSYLINLQHVREFIRKDGGFVIMTNGEELPVSTQKREELIAAIGSLR